LIQEDKLKSALIADQL